MLVNKLAALTGYPAGVASLLLRVECEARRGESPIGVAEDYIARYLDARRMMELADRMSAGMDPMEAMEALCEAYGKGGREAMEAVGRTLWTQR